MIEYAEALSTTPAIVTDELRDRMQREFTAKQLAELTNVIAWENARARFNRAFDIQPEGYTAD